LAGVGGVDPGLAIDAVVGGDEPAAFVGVDGSAVGVTQHVVLAGAPAGRDAGQQCGRNMAGRRIVVTFSRMSRLYFAASCGSTLRGVIGCCEEGFTQ
jgi:hypothetical protein